MQVRKQQIELDMEQQTGSKKEKEFVKAVYCHSVYLTYMQSTSWETLDWICSNYCTVALISHTTKVMLKILQAKVQQYMNHEIPDVQAGFRKGRGNRDQIANIRWIIEKAREFQKNI